MTTAAGAKTKTAAMSTMAIGTQRAQHQAYGELPGKKQRQAGQQPRHQQHRREQGNPREYLARGYPAARGVAIPVLPCAGPGSAVT